MSLNLEKLKRAKTAIVVKKADWEAPLVSKEAATEALRKHISVPVKTTQYLQDKPTEEKMHDAATYQTIVFKKVELHYVEGERSPSWVLAISDDFDHPSYHHSVDFELCLEQIHQLTICMPQFADKNRRSYNNLHLCETLEYLFSVFFKIGKQQPIAVIINGPQWVKFPWVSSLRNSIS